MKVELSAEAAKVVSRELEQGEYTSAAEIIDDALALLVFYDGSVPVNVANRSSEWSPAR